MSSLRLLRQAACSARSFSTSAASRRDIVQDLYIRELKAYKPTPVAKDAHLGAVKPFSPIQPPKPPTLPVDLAAELAAYDAIEPTTAGEPATPSLTGEFGQGAEAFLTFLEADVKPAEAHH
ncbi:ATP synthase complex subunit H-domain-containing protein [Pisolithus tinctorius]|nr:ATP synthase complex subunit H-domain-containing protein [Pisolithus tinctorius]